MVNPKKKTFLREKEFKQVHQHKIIQNLTNLLKSMTK